ncbi:hypothetical protein J4423_02705 [Candidatus Pacearchaeota archaeon]|nr:hypothetical protein [Candidatus Pacearchaeota archaeon]
MNTLFLNEIGLSESEKNVYLALLDLGDSTRGDIVNKSKVAGSKVYELLQKLQNKGLVSIYLKDGIKHFKPTNPSQILNYIEEKKSKILGMENDANSILPQLMLRFNSSKKEQEVELLSGLRGLEVIFREQVEMMKKGDTCYVIGGTRGSDEEIVQGFFEKIHVMRQEKGIKTKMLFNEVQRKSTKELYSQKKYSGTETRYLEHTSPVAINVYKDRTVIIIFGNEITSIYIKSRDVAQSFLEYFNMLWSIGKR